MKEKRPKPVSDEYKNIELFAKQIICVSKIGDRQARSGVSEGTKGQKEMEGCVSTNG